MTKRISSWRKVVSIYRKKKAKWERRKKAVVARASIASTKFIRSLAKGLRAINAIVARDKKALKRKAKPWVTLFSRYSRKSRTVLGAKVKVGYETASKKYTKGKRVAKVHRQRFGYLFALISPSKYQYFKKRYNAFKRFKKRTAAYLLEQSKVSSHWFGKMCHTVREIKVYLLYLNLFGKKKRVHHTPTFLQMEATECGSICFSIILAYYKHELSAEEARSACGVSRDGSKASHIVQAAQRYNMTAKGYSVKDLANLDDCTLPAIIHWNFDHFVVLEGRIGNYFFINDPAAGRRRVDFDEFNQNFTGIILILTPTKGFVQQRQENAVLEFLKLSLTRGVGGIMAAFFLSILQILPTILIAFSSKIFIDFIIAKNMAYWLIPMTLILAGCVVLQSFLLALHQRLLVRLGIHFNLSLESMIVHKLFSLPLRFFDQRFSGDILYRLSSVDELSKLLSIEIMGALSNVFGLVVFAIILSQLSFPLLLIMFLFIALRVGVFYLNRNSIRESNIHYQQQFGKVAGIAMNGLDMIDTLKANNLEHVFFKNWAANHDLLLNKHQRVALIDQRTTIWLLVLAGMMSIALFYKGTYLVMGEQITIGTLMAFIILSSYLDTPLMTLLDFSSKIEKIKASINRFNDILKHKTLEETVVGKGAGSVIDIKPLSNKIALKNITFAYAPLDPPIFENLNLSIPRGKTVAIVGVSGSGKSTISKIICGLYPIKSGEILWDKLPIQDVAEELRTKRISLVDQDIYLFDGTVRDNLTSWDKNIDDETLVEALKNVGLYQELLPRGLLNSPVGENGACLSGGQRQRLEIARALIRKADVLILDEATSSLDVPNETHVFESLSKLNITTIIIAHRLSTIKKSDVIYVIDEGKVVQTGSHKELAKKNGVYKNLVNLETA